MGPGALLLLAIRDDYSVAMLSREENKQYVTLVDPKQGCGVGVARSRGNEPGVGVDQTASTQIPVLFV